MPKRNVHEVSDSEDDMATEEGASAPSRSTKHAPKRKIKACVISDDEEAEEAGASPPDGSPMSTSRADHDSRALASMDTFSAQSQVSLLCLDLDEDVERTPKPFRVMEAPKRAPRKLHYQMYAFVVDRSPSEENGLEDYGSYIVKRKVIDTFMRMRLDKFQKHHTLVITCCDKNTDNLSNREQEKTLNKHCVEILSAEEVTVDQIRELSGATPFAPEDEQFSNVIAGLMTAADIISRSAAELEPYEKTEVTLFSDLNFDRQDSSITKMSRVLSVVLSEAHLTIISNKAAIASEDFKTNLSFLEEIFDKVEVLPYKEAKKKSEEWTMAEQVPAKFGASIKLFDEEIPTEAYLVCNEKNSSLLKTRLEKVSDSAQSVSVAESSLREEKKLVKLTDDGHFMKNDDGCLVIVDPERAAMAYKFGTTAVPTEKTLAEYVPSEPSHKGYVVRGWYPANKFALYVNGGKAYRVFPGSEQCSAFDSLLMSCARKGYALLVDYSYQARSDPKPGVLIPHRKKRCFVYYDLVHEDNLNYLPRYDPITTVKPPAGNLKKMCDIIAESQIDHLDLKYDPASQQIIEDCWRSEIGETSWKFHEKFSEVTFKKDATLLSKIEDFKENAEGFVRRLTVQRKQDEPDRIDDLIPFNVESLDDDQIEKLDAKALNSILRS